MPEADNRSIKADFQINQLSRAAHILFTLFSLLKEVIRPGCSGLEVQTFILEYLAKTAARAALRGYKGFQADISISVNEVAAHGIPSSREFQPGDLVTIDCAVLYKGWYGDMAWTYSIPPLTVRNRRLIGAAWQACLSGCRALLPGTSMGTLGSHVINAARRLGGRVVNEFCGHSIGRKLHEAPIIPYTKRPGHGWLVQKGMVLNMEPVVTLGDPAVVLDSAGSVYLTKDKSPTAQFELTCLVGGDGMRILSLPGLAMQDMLEYPPFF